MTRSLLDRALSIPSALTLVALVASGAHAATLDVPGEFATIPEAIAAAVDGDEIVVQPGVYVGNVNPLGKAITIRSTDPNDPDIVAQTVLDGGGEQVVSFFSGEGIDTVVEGFTITGGDAELGGGIGILVSDPTLRQLVVRGNQATSGGGMYAYVSSTLCDGCVFVENGARDGGAVYAYATSYLRFNDCKIVDNEANSRGGGAYSFFADVRFDRCEFTDNIAGTAGGAYAGRNSKGRFHSTLMRDNTAPQGGALDLDDDSPDLVNTTIVRNTATGPGQGGALYGIFSQPLVRNSIVRDNAPNEFGGFANPTAEYSNVEGGLPGPGNIDEDPLFVAPELNDFRLSDGSPSANAGLNGWVPAFSTRDLDGDLRLLDDVVDMGAYEAAGRARTFQVTPESLVLAVREQFSLSFGIESPLVAFDTVERRWNQLVRTLPAYAFAADPENEVFWVHSGENGSLGRVPFDTLELEEIGLLKLDGGLTATATTGMAVRDGVLYASAWRLGQPDVLYTVDTETARLTEVAEFPEEFELWDLHYDRDADRLLALSSPEVIPAVAVGVYEIDLETFELTEALLYTNPDPFTQLNYLQGLATANGAYFLFRSPYAAIEVYDEASQSLLASTTIPDFVPRAGVGWLWGGLDWIP